MDSIKGTVEATIQLTKANCYYMTHGVCSLSVIEDHFISPTERVQPNDLFYCPRLYALMCGREKDKAIPAVPCNCGHVQILGNPQRACIAERKELVLQLEINDDKTAIRSPVDMHFIVTRVSISIVLSSTYTCRPAADCSKQFLRLPETIFNFNSSGVAP